MGVNPLEPVREPTAFRRRPPYVLFCVCHVKIRAAVGFFHPRDGLRRARNFYIFIRSRLKSLHSIRSCNSCVIGLSNPAALVTTRQ